MDDNGGIYQFASQFSVRLNSWLQSEAKIEPPYSLTLQNHDILTRNFDLISFFRRLFHGLMISVAFMTVHIIFNR